MYRINEMTTVTTFPSCENPCIHIAEGFSASCLLEPKLSDHRVCLGRNNYIKAEFFVCL